MRKKILPLVSCTALDSSLSVSTGSSIVSSCSGGTSEVELIHETLVLTFHSFLHLNPTYPLLWRSTFPLFFIGIILIWIVRLSSTSTPAWFFWALGVCIVAWLPTGSPKPPFWMLWWIDRTDFFIQILIKLFFTFLPCAGGRFACQSAPCTFPPGL